LEFWSFEFSWRTLPPVQFLHTRTLSSLLCTSVWDYPRQRRKKTHDWSIWSTIQELKFGQNWGWLNLVKPRIPEFSGIFWFPYEHYYHLREGKGGISKKALNHEFPHGQITNTVSILKPFGWLQYNSASGSSSKKITH
jgi:hypothetical protein